MIRPVCTKVRFILETRNFIRVALTMGCFFGAVAIQLAVIFVWNKVDLQIEK